MAAFDRLVGSDMGQAGLSFETDQLLHYTKIVVSIKRTAPTAVTRPDYSTQTPCSNHVNTMKLMRRQSVDNIA